MEVEPSQSHCRIAVPAPRLPLPAAGRATSVTTCPAPLGPRSIANEAPLLMAFEVKLSTPEPLDWTAYDPASLPLFDL